MTTARVYISHDLSLMVHGNMSVDVHSNAAGADVNVTAEELPDFIARLKETAEGMGVETKQGELVKACKAALPFIGHGTEAEKVAAQLALILSEIGGSNE